MPTINPKQLLTWFSVVSTILVLFGIVYAFFGLAILPVDRETLLPWEGAIYGALMMGWGTTLLCVGRLAFRRNDAGLMKAVQPEVRRQDFCLHRLLPNMLVFIPNELETRRAGE